MRRGAVLFMFSAVLLLGSTDAWALFDKRPPAEKRADILVKSAQILQELYQVEPHTKQAIESAYGYATFSNFGTKIFVAGGGTGKGVVFRNDTGEKTFMKMVEVQAGLGLGIKKFKLIWVFETQSGFDQFVNSGWELGGQATAAAKLDDSGGAYQGAVAVAPGIWVYQLTDSGLALELTAKGTKYYPDKKLN